MHHDDLIDLPSAVPTPPLPSPAPPEPAWNGEVIAGFRVHSATSLFPLMEGEQFTELVESIVSDGVAVPIELHGGMLIEGRNRARAVEAARAMGVTIELPTVEWNPTNGQSVEEHVYRCNVTRRHLTDDQRAIVATMLLPGIRASRAARQEASRFRGERAAERPEAAATISEQPAGPRSSRERFETSSVGRIAALASISKTKAQQAIALADAVAAGAIPPEQLLAVQRGERLLRQAVPPRTRKKKACIRKTPLLRPAAEAVLDDGDVQAAGRRVCRENGLADWNRIKQQYAAADHREYRELILAIIAAERQECDC